MATLVLLQGGEAKPYELTSEDVVIGRHPDCGVQLQSNMVSRKHAHVVRKNNNYYVEDLGSGNGTFVNGKKIEKATVLKHDDRIKLGPVLLRFESTDSVSQRRAALLGDSQGNSSLFGSPAETTPFKLDIAAGPEDSATIMGSSDGVSGYGVLEVQPEAKLKAILEISRSLAENVDTELILPTILETLFKVFPQADRGCVLLKDPETGQMIPAVQKHRREEEDSTVKLSRTILNKVLEEKTGILSADATADSRFANAESISSLTIRSMMCVPLLGLDGEPMGLINIDTQNPLSQFSQDDLDLLLAVASQAALSYESTRLLVSHIEKQKQDNEMQIARNVQRALLPSQLPEVDGYQFFASYDSAQAVGGDYYDSFMLDENNVCLSFGDVAGKGVPGAIIMSRMATVVQSTMAFVHDLGQAISTINNLMCVKAVEGRFVTYILVILDIKSHTMSLVNAGHMSPLIRRPGGTVDEFDDEQTGVPIGVVADYPYEVVTRSIEPGETVVIVTDGVDEAMNPAGDLYTKDRVVEFVRQGSANADELGRALLADVRKHADGRPQNDDITIMTFGRDQKIMTFGRDQK